MLFNPHAEDSVFLNIPKSGKFKLAKLSLLQLGYAIKGALPRVDWWRLIWFPKDNPRHGFIAWLARQNKLYTEHRKL